MALSQSRSRLIKRLRGRKSRQREGLVLVEGVRSVEEALSAGVSPSFVVLSPRLEGGAAGRGLAADLRGRLDPAALHDVSDAELDDVSDTEHPQGVLLVCAEPREGLEDVLGRGDVLVLDAVRDPGNVGTLVRSAVAFGFGAIVCLDGTVDPWSPKSVRASAGLVFRIPIAFSTIPAFAESLRARGIDCLVAAADGVAIDSGEYDRARALVVGNEGAGVRDELRAVAATTVAVPMTGPVESLNVGIAGSILMHEMSRKRMPRSDT